MPHTIFSALQSASETISSISDTARMDAEILLAHVLNRSRSYLYAWPEESLTVEQKTRLNDLIGRRVNGEPVPYLTGHQEFWSLDLVVTPDTLIPRPETELLVELALKISFSSNEKRIIADLGTGSGAIALAIAYERPCWRVYATDQSEKALFIAKLNAQQLNLKNSYFYQGDWCHALPDLLFDVIISNPPYIAEGDPHLLQHNLRFEPQCALISGDDGLNAMRDIIREAKKHLKGGAYLMVEHGYDQAARVRALMETAGYENIFSHVDLAGVERVTLGTNEKK